MAEVPERENGRADPRRGMTDGITRRARERAQSLRERVDGLGASMDDVRGQVTDRVGSAVRAVRDATRTSDGVPWADAEAASRPLLTAADLDRVREAVPTGECRIASPFGHGWPGRLRVLVQDGRTVGHVHLLRRPTRATIAHGVALGLDVAMLTAVLATSPMAALMVDGIAGDDSWYDAALHDATGRVLLWTRPVDPEDRTAIEVMLPDGTAIAMVRRDPQHGRRRWGRQHGSARVTGLGPLAGTELTSATPAVWWNASVGGPDDPTTWVDRAGTPVARVLRRAPDLHVDLVAGPATLLAACGALWWWTHRKSTG